MGKDNMFDRLINGDMQQLSLQLHSDERKTKLKQEFDKRIVGQDKAKNELIDAIVDATGEIVPSHGPMGVFLFTGPSGTGKTHSVRALAEILLGNENAFTMIRGEQLQDSHAKSNLIGSPRGYVGSDKQPFLNKGMYKAYETAQKNGTLNPLVKRYQGFNILLIDEADKMHYEVWQTLLGIFDDGHIELAIGETLDFSSTLIIMTSNLGAREMKDVDEKRGIGFVEPDKTKEKSKVMQQQLKKFSPEMLGRIHAIINFDELTREDCLKIIDMHRMKINKVFKEMGNNEDDNFPELELLLSKEVEKFILDNGFSGKKGARDLVRFFRKHVERTLGTLVNSLPELEDVSEYKIPLVAEMIEDKVTFTAYGDKVELKPQPKMPLVTPIKPIVPIKPKKEEKKK